MKPSLMILGIFAGSLILSPSAFSAADEDDWNKNIITRSPQMLSLLDKAKHAAHPLDIHFFINDVLMAFFFAIGAGC